MESGTQHTRPPLPRPHTFLITYKCKSITSDYTKIVTGSIAYFHFYNPRGEPMTELVRAIGTRWPIEECFEAAKSEAGLDNYQVRLYHAWYRHITLSMLALAFLAVMRHKSKRGPCTGGQPERPDGTDPARPARTPINQPTPNPPPDHALHRRSPTPVQPDRHRRSSHRPGPTLVHLAPRAPGTHTTKPLPTTPPTTNANDLAL
jgi:hypothetical protein